MTIQELSQHVTQSVSELHQNLNRFRDETNRGYAATEKKVDAALKQLESSPLSTVGLFLFGGLLVAFGFFLGRL